MNVSVQHYVYSLGNRKIDMNERECRVCAARMKISDERLIAFFRAIRGKTRVLAIKLINDHLDEGKRLDEIFYTGKDYGFHLSVKQRSESRYEISFGCIAGPLAGDGGSWEVLFDGDTVRSVNNTDFWIC